MPDQRTDQSWGTSQLVEFLAVLSGQSDEAGASRAAVERMLESLDAEIGALVDPDGTAAVVVGLAPDDERLAAIVAAHNSTVDIEGLGACRTATVALDVGPQAQRLVVARLSAEEFMPAEQILLRGMAWVLNLARRQLQVLTALNERQKVLEHLARVQRGIVARAPLPEVFDSVTESALSLVGSEFAVLHLLDRDGLAVVSISGRAQESRPPTWALRMSADVARAVYSGQAPVTTEATVAVAGSTRDTRVAMGAPVRENGAVVGSLVVISPADRGAFAENQQQACARSPTRSAWPWPTPRPRSPPSTPCGTR